MFRARIIESTNLPQQSFSSYLFEPPHPLQRLRQQIKMFRKHLADYGEEMLSQDKQLEPLVREALRIPADVPLLPTGAAKFYQCLMQLLPVYIVVRRAKNLLRGIGTHEGRHLVFALQINRTFPGQHYFNPGLDFALRELQAPISLEAFRDMHFYELNWMRACHQLGIRRMDEVDQLIKALSSHQIDGALVLALVDLEVIATVDALARLPKRSEWYYHDQELTRVDVRRFREVVQLLRDAGVVPHGITRLVNLDVKRFDPHQLATTLGLIGLIGPELSRLFETLGEQVMRVEPERWVFLNETLGVRSPADLERFKKLLDSGRKPSKEFSLALRAAGARVVDLEACQSLILSIGGREKAPAPITEMHLLLDAPHSFTFIQLAEADDYLLAERNLGAYLLVLIRHGFGDAQSVLAFQCCYKQLNADTLDRWLSIAGERAKGQAATVIADWILQAGRGGHVDSVDYLLQAGELHAFIDLKRALKLAPLGTSLLRYVREERGLKSLSVLLKWYYHDAPGIKDVRLWGELNAVSRVLLDDAFERKDFTLLEGNLDSVRKVIDRRIDGKLGHFPFSSDESVREAYRRSSHQMHEEISDEIAPKLRTLLTESDGVLLLSLLEHIESPLEVVREKLAQLTPELAKLRTGGGPVGQTLSDLEADLIAVVYRTTSSTVRNHWPHVIGREGDIAGLSTRAPYSMNWNRTAQQLDGQLDPRGLKAMQAALKFAKRFTARRADMREACRHLSPKRLHDDAADIWSLALHLGVLIAIAAEDSNVREWLDQGAETIERMAEAGPLVRQQVESLHKLFDVQLGDALDILEARFIEGLTEPEAAVLVSRLDKQAAAGALSARDGLKIGLLKARKKVLAVFLHWTTQQKKRFDPIDVEGDCDQLLAYVSKSPAAFFAKEAAGICTRANTAMWQERRNTHLLVFAPDQKRLVGMALLYFECVDTLDANRDTLIIRAINPMADALASYGVASIVDSYFDVAIRIALDNGLAAVAFPSPMGMHLMSNHQTLENDIRERFMKHAQSLSAWSIEKQSPHQLRPPRKVDATFYAYESGQTRVDELYVIWRRSSRIE
ncbi:hypothetical protein [Azospira oryzae]|nr:hypothetical protein [Azospira oryzae]